MTNTEQFAAVLAESLRGTHYDPKTNKGTARVGTVGYITFCEASNDPAVIVNLSNPPRFKGTAEAALQFLDRLSEAFSNSD